MEIANFHPLHVQQLTITRESRLYLAPLIQIRDRFLKCQSIVARVTDYTVTHVTKDSPHKTCGVTVVNSRLSERYFADCTPVALFGTQGCKLF